MKNGTTPHGQLHESYVLQIDGRVKSSHRRFVDALRAGLLLKDQFPHHAIKVRAVQASSSAAEAMRETVLH
jgi:hypothetical protein